MAPKNSDDRGMRQFQDVVGPLRDTYDEVKDLQKKKNKRAGPLISYIDEFIGALIAYDLSNGTELYDEFEEEYEKVKREHDIYEKLNDHSKISDAFYHDVKRVLSYYRQEMDMGYQVKSKKKDLRQPLRLSKLVDKDIHEVVEVYQLCMELFDTEDSEVIKQKLRGMIDES
ncbi:MAG: hypothetical protein V5A88_07350 [Candidatus Thermoplasmatota archaeon]